jgi:hypothetical protein
MLCRRKRSPVWPSGQSSWLQNGDVLCFLWGTNWIYICYIEESRPPVWSSGQSSWIQNGSVLCFLWGTNWIFISHVEESRPPLWFSGQIFWLQIQRCGFDSQRYQIFWELVGLERGPISLVSTIEELLGRKCSGSSLKIKEYGRKDPSRWLRGNLYPQKLALTSPTSGGRSVGIVRSRSQAMEFFYQAKTFPCYYYGNRLHVARSQCDVASVLLREHSYGIQQQSEWDSYASRMDSETSNEI